MNDYVQRNELSPVDRVASRPVTPVVAVRSGNNSDLAKDLPTPAAAVIPVDKGDGADMDAASETQLASAAEYARVHAEVADILASIRSASGNAQTIADSADALNALAPTPIVIVPMFPASRDMVEEATHIARKLVDNAALAHAAQAHIKPGTVDQILSQVA